MRAENAQDILTNIEVQPDLKIATARVFQSDTMSFYLASVAGEVPCHYHKLSDEMYYIYKGRGRMRVGGEYRDVGQGDIIIIPKGAVHGLKNTTPGDLVIFFITSPPFDPDKDRFVV
jgi:mannose-6-phosphate isomerase-like protein (cupin superfamily)